MAIDWIQNKRKKASTYAINVYLKAALLAMVNKHATHPLAVDTRRKTTELNSELQTYHHVR
jgi:hypothetical protein